jgi:uncharacterized protein (TIGR02588 family)
MAQDKREQTLENEAGTDNASDIESEDGRTAEQRRADNNQPLLLEWVVAFIGLALVAGAIGFMLYQAITANNSPPNITVRVDSIVLTSDGYLVTFHVFNSGELTAAELVVEGELKLNGERVESSTATIDYVPSLSERRGGLHFTRDPQQFELHLRAQGYEHP